MSLELKQLVKDMAGSLGIDESEFNERTARAVMLYNQNNQVDSFQLRYRKALPLRVGISVVNAYECRDNKPVDLTDLVNQTAWYYTLFFGGTFHEASSVVKGYINRMLRVGFLSSASGLIRLNDGYAEKILLLLAKDANVSAQNAYVKAMGVTVANACLTEKEPWQHPPEDIAWKVNTEFIRLRVLKTLRRPEDIVDVHIKPLLHEAVRFYTLDREQHLGIPAVSVIKSPMEQILSKLASNPLFYIPKNLECLADLSSHPLVSLDRIAVKYGMDTALAIERACYDPSLTEIFPFVVVPDPLAQNKILVSRRVLDTLDQYAQRAGSNFRYSQMDFKSDPLWLAIAKIVSDLYKLDKGPDVVKKLVNLILDHNIPETDVSDVERQVLFELYSRGRIVDYDEQRRCYVANNKEKLRVLRSILEVWRIGGTIRPNW